MEHAQLMYYHFEIGTNHFLPFLMRYSWKNSGCSSSHASILICSSSLSLTSSFKPLTSRSSSAASEVIVLLLCLRGQDTGGEGLKLSQLKVCLVQPLVLIYFILAYALWNHFDLRPAWILVVTKCHQIILLPICFHYCVLTYHFKKVG